jgi:hypothetical protein
MMLGCTPASFIEFALDDLSAAARILDAFQFG